MTIATNKGNQLPVEARLFTSPWEGESALALMLMGVKDRPIMLNVPNRVVYSPHDYGPNLFRQQWFNSSTTYQSLVQVWESFWGYLHSTATAPVWVGEPGELRA